MTRKITIAIIHAVTLGLVAYDIWVAVEPSPRDTLSKVGLDEMTKHPSIAVLAGVLIGHIAWPMVTYGARAEPGSTRSPSLRRSGSRLSCATSSEPGGSRDRLDTSHKPKSTSCGTGRPAGAYPFPPG